MNRFFHAVLTVCLPLLASLAFAAPPQTINYQGFLTSSAGAPANGPVVMTFKLYNAASSGSLLYTEVQNPVTITNGNFNAVIGTFTPITLPFDVPYWLTVTINADGEMTPRQPLASSPYAFRAFSLESTATVQGSQLSGTITGAQVPAGNLTGVLVGAQIANNAITQAKLSPVAGATAGRVLGTDGSNLQWQASVGTVTSVATGSGLTGGPITGSGSINLAPTQLLPATACASNQIAKWSGSAWTCAADDNAPPGGAAGQVLAGTAGAPAWTASPSLSGNLTLADSSTSTTGNIMKGGNPFLHNFGSQNTFIGENAGNFAMTGIANSASGANALAGNTSGFNNTASGYRALQINSTGHSNTASGAHALENNLSYENTANGASALQLNTSGSGNTASGLNALLNNTTGDLNTSSGRYALHGNTTGTSNTAFGAQALGSSTTGNLNIAIGFGAGFNLTTGSNNIYVGDSGISPTVESGVIRIGQLGSHFLAYIRGIYNAPALINGATVYVEPDGRLGTNPSSRRFKDDITDMNAASSALMNLRPVTFHYKTDQHPSGRTLQYGLIAEEVAEVYPGLVIHSADGEIDAVAYQHLPPMLLNEFQKQQRTIAAQAVELAQQRTKTDMLERKLLNIEALLAGR